MLNRIVLHGRFVRDPELRATGGGISVCPFTLAVDRDVKSKDGERKTDFIDCVAWRGTAEFVKKHFHKGSSAVVDGRLELRDWTDDEGNKHRIAEVRIDNIYFGESKKPAAAAHRAAADGTANFEEMPDIDDEDLPF